MRCPLCGSLQTKVVDSREGRDGTSIRRRRECSQCVHRFTTHERLDDTLPMVCKSSGEREPFARNKVLRGLQIACRKRPVSQAQLEEAADHVEQWAVGCGDREIQSSAIGGRLMHELHALDAVAYVRFVSVYRSFESVEEFAALLQEMEKAEQVDTAGQRPLFPARIPGHVEEDARAAEDAASAVVRAATTRAPTVDDAGTAS